MSLLLRQICISVYVLTLFLLLQVTQFFSLRLLSQTEIGCVIILFLHFVSILQVCAHFKSAESLLLDYAVTWFSSLLVVIIYVLLVPQSLWALSSVLIAFLRHDASLFSLFILQHFVSLVKKLLGSPIHFFLSETLPVTSFAYFFIFSLILALFNCGSCASCIDAISAFSLSFSYFFIAQLFCISKLLEIIYRLFHNYMEHNLTVRYLIKNCHHQSYSV